MDHSDGLSTTGQRQTPNLPTRPLARSAQTLDKVIPQAPLANVKDAASINSNELASSSLSLDEHLIASCRDLSPHETSACERITSNILTLRSAQDVESTASDTGGARTVESVLREAALTIQYNSKWFAEESLGRVLDNAIALVQTSSSSTELLAAVRLIDVISIYSYLPQTCIAKVVRFIAQTYHGARRAMKTKKLAMTTWDVFERLLASHLGDQCIVHLLEIIETAGAPQLQTQSGYSQVVGALHLLMERFETQNSALSVINVPDFLAALHSLSNHSFLGVCEDIVEALSLVLEDEATVASFDDSIVWDLVVETFESCMRHSNRCPDAEKVFVKIIDHVHEMEERHFGSLARLALSFKIPVPKLMADTLTNCASILDEGDDHQEMGSLQQILLYLGQATTNSDSFDRLLNQKLPIILDLSPPATAIVIIATFEKILDDVNTPPKTISLLADCVITQLRHYMFRDERIFRRLFELCCRLSGYSTRAAEQIMKVRADAQLHMYIDGLRRGRSFAKVNDFPPLSMLDAAVINSIKAPRNWDIYICFISRLSDLVSNHSLFQTRFHAIKELKEVVCHQLKSASYAELSEGAGVSKAYVAKILIQALTTMITYHDRFKRHELVSMISVFLEVSGTRDASVRISCIHALSVCCYELPVTMASYMDDVIDKMAKMVTQKMLAIHVLQFLAGLSRLPDLFRNFKEHDYKKIFGVCGNYLQSIRGTGVLDPIRSSRTDVSGNLSPSDELPQYVYALAHHVICFWYIAIKPNDRKPLKPYITSCLKYRTDEDVDAVDDQALVTLDLMDAMDEEDEEEKNELERCDYCQGVSCVHKIAGTMLITTPRDGHSVPVVDIRRPSGRWLRPLGLSAEKQSTTADSTFALAFWDAQLLKKSPELDRAIQSLDRIPGLDSHKAGLIYVGEGQTQEFDILQNSSGSPDFWQLVDQLGEPRRLHGATFNTHGLDRENDLDGTSTIVWENAVTQLVYHVTPLMPKDLDTIINKKKHIGNDAVNIVFNNAGLPFSFNTLPTQVTHAYLVIEPCDRTSFLQARSCPQPKTHTSSNLDSGFYKIHILTRPGYPSVSPVVSAKVVSGSSLAAFVRNLVLNECIFALMWDHRHEAPGEFPSSWRARLRQLRLIRDRYLEDAESTKS